MSKPRTYIANRGFAPTTSFSGTDMIVDIVFPDSKSVRIGTASTLTYSTFREKHQIRTLGRISNKGFTYGPRTIGGTMIFTIINEHFINDLKQRVPLLQRYDKIKPDELPPFDVVVTFANEYGQSAKMVIYGITIIDDGVVLSVEDMLTENTMTYMARDIEHMKSTTDGSDIYSEMGQMFLQDNRPITRFTIRSKTSAQQVLTNGTTTSSSSSNYTSGANQQPRVIHDPYHSYAI